MRAQLRKPGACGVLSLEVKYDPAFRLKCTATLIIDDIQHSRKSCHDEYEFKTVPFTIPCCKLHFYHPKLLHIKLQFSKRNKQTPLLPLPEINSIYHAESAGSRDQPRPGSFLKKREEPGNEVGFSPDIQRLSELKSEQKNHYKADSLQNNSILLYTFKTFSAINEQKQH